MITNNVNYPAEQSFAINANARSITVPGEFGKNGVGVVGDHAAEALEFEIARYFDDIDLANATEVEVRWNNPAGKSGIYKVPESDIVRTNPDSLLFTWILTKDAIGAKSGSIKFNVRISVGDIKFNTQPQSISIKNGLELAGEVLEDDSEGAYNLRHGIGASDLAQPVVLATDLAPSAPLGTLTVALQGVEGDYGDHVVARWYKDGELILDNNGNPVNALSYEPVAPGTYQVILITTKKVVDEKAMCISGEEIEFKYHSSIASHVSSKCVIGAPALIEIVKNLAAEFVGPAIELEVAIPSEGEVKAQLMFCESKDGEFAAVGEAVVVAEDGKVALEADKDGFYKIVLTHSLNNGTKETESAVARIVLNPVVPMVTVAPEETTLKVKPTLMATISNSAAMSDVSYQWFFADDEQMLESAIKIDGATEDNYKPLSIKAGGLGSGLYKVVVTNSKLVGKEVKSESVSSDVVKVNN